MGNGLSPAGDIWEPMQNTPQNCPILQPLGVSIQTPGAHWLRAVLAKGLSSTLENVQGHVQGARGTGAKICLELSTLPCCN